MTYEIEVKARMRDEAAVRAALMAQGCTLSDPIVQDDTVYLPKGVDPLNGYAGLNVLRIRRQGDRAIFTLKQNRGNELDCLEHETDITDPEQLDAIIRLLGFELFARVRKARQKGKLGEYEVCLDHVDDLGDFIEVEKMTNEENGEAVQTELFTFLQRLGVSPSDRVFNGYDTLMWQKIASHQ